MLIAAASHLPFHYLGTGALSLFTAAGISILPLIFFKAGSGTGSSAETSVIIPIGLSYYVLRAIHYSVDKYKGTIPAHSFADYAGYLFFLPTFASGPINRFQEFHRNLQRRRWDGRLFSRGCERILYGFAKIVILGNYLVSLKFVQLIERLAPSHPSLSAYLDCVRYGLNLLFQFSGYSDMAIGFALLLGFRISENFNYPLLAININDFWKRWHISLSEWCRDYIFMPVLSIGRLPVAAIMASMLVLGLWHEFSGRYVAWGLYHGAGIALWHFFQKAKPFLPSTKIFVGNRVKVLSWSLNINFVLLSFAITKEPDIVSALRVYQKIFLFWS